VTSFFARCVSVALLVATGCASAKPGAAPDTAPPVTVTPVTQRVVLMSISSNFVKNPKAGFTLITRIDASGKSANFSREASVICASLGELEKLIGEMVRKQTGY